MASPAIPLDSKHATGPRTPEGKARSAQNSRKHGFSAKSLEVLPSEQADFEIYENELLSTIKPQPGPQADLFHQLLHAGWTLRRLTRYELEILERGNPFDSTEAQAKLDRLERYRSGHRRAYARILNEIRKLQTDAMLWSTTHDVVKERRDVDFPMANPAAPRVNRGIAEISDHCKRQDAIRIYSADETADSSDSSQPAASGKTNSLASLADSTFAHYMAMCAANGGRK